MVNCTYEVQDRYFKNLNVIKITAGDFNGVCFVFGRVALDVDEANDVATLQFDFHFENPQNKVLENNQTFLDTVGDILIDLIEEEANERRIVFTGGRSSK